MLTRQQKEKIALGARMSGAAYDVLTERERQICKEGWSCDHDDAHEDGDLAKAAGAYALHSTLAVIDVSRGPSKKDQIVISGRRFWPWDWKYWKPKDSRNDLVKAGALIIAEIERLDRASAIPPAHREDGAQ